MQSKERSVFPHPLPRLLLLALAGILLLLSGCAVPQVSSAPLLVTLRVDGKEQILQAAAGASVQSLLDQNGVTVQTLDRIEPPAYTLITQNTTIRVIRVREDFEVKETVIPFQKQTVKNEALPQGQTLLIQPGVNGVQQVTYRTVFEDGQEISNGIFKSVILSEARPEILMVGVQTPFSSIDIPGRLVYLTAGNAWVMEETTGKRRPVATSSDLDGHIFTLSPDGTWLLYTRKAAPDQKDTINTLWAVNVTVENPAPVNLRVSNVIHFAQWVPGAIMTITYSTVEPREAAPGWQANNDLQLLSFTATGGTLRAEELIETNSGGLYGWWGNSYAWSPDGTRLAYARPDSVGIVNLETKEFTPVMDILPVQTGRSWAWVPGLSWSPDGKFLYTLSHAVKPGMDRPEESPLFDVTAIPVEGGAPIPLAPKSGMFAYPSASPFVNGEGYTLAYLQAIFPEQSETSKYRLVWMDCDGSNRSNIFPPEGSPGLEPQQIVWASSNELSQNANCSSFTRGISISSTPGRVNHSR